MTKPEISVQLYSIHSELDDDLDGSLRWLAELGLRTVEAFDFVRRADALMASFDRYGLSAPTAHAILIEEEGVATPDGLLSVPPAEETFTAAVTLGMQVVIDPFVSPDRWTTLADVQRNAERLNARAVQAQTFGLRVGYHNHDHELSSMINGRSALEVFADLLEPSVLLEVEGRVALTQMHGGLSARRHLDRRRPARVVWHLIALEEAFESNTSSNVQRL